MRRKNTIIILSAMVCLSFIGFIFTIAYEKDTNKINESKQSKPQIENKYFEKADQLGVEKENFLLNSLSRSIKKVDSQDRTYKLISSILSEYIHLINTQQLEKAYTMLDSEYAEDFGVSYNIFEAKNKGEKIDRYVISNIEDVKTEKIVAIEYFIIQEDGVVSQDMSVINENGEYKLTLHGISEITEIGTEYKVNGLKSTINKRYKIGNYIAYKIILENTSGKDIQINNHAHGFFGIIQNQKYSHKLINVTNPYLKENYIIGQGEKKNYIIQFNTKQNLAKIGVEFDDGEIAEIPVHTLELRQ